MPNYPFPPAIALDEPSGGIARNAEGQVYEVSDTAFATPLAVTDLAGVPMTALTSSNQGIIPAFRVTVSQPRVMWKSGGSIIEILSNDGILAEIAAAVQSSGDAAQNAEQSRIAAEDAAQLVGAPSDVAVAALVSTEGTATRAAVVELIETTAGPGGGGSPYGVVAVHRNAGDTDWEFATYEACVAATGLVSTMTLQFVGLANPPGWASQHPRVSLWTQGG